jgi:hypothetical protein
MVERVRSKGWHLEHDKLRDQHFQKDDCKVAARKGGQEAIKEWNRRMLL